MTLNGLFLQVLYEKQEENVSKEAAAKLALEALNVSKRKLAEVLDEIRQQSHMLLEEERVALLREGKSRIRSRGAEIATSQVVVSYLIVGSHG